MKFGENLYQLRKSSKMSQEKLAEKVGVSRQSISKWENSEAYPEMENIMKLCKIFHCKINTLVHDDIQDIDSLDEETKMTKVKFEKEKQKKLKVISKIIYVIARIAKILSRIGAIGLAMGVLIGLIFINSHTAQSIISTYVKIDHTSLININELLNQYSPLVLSVILFLLGSIFITALNLLSMTMKHLENLFINIYNGDTPFTLENVNHIKKMSYFMIAITLLTSFGNAISSGILKQDVDFDLGFDLINILFLYSIAYIFEYGYEIQLDSKGRIYGDENE